MAEEGGAVRLASFDIPEVVPIASGGALGARTSSTLPSVLFAPSHEAKLYAGFEAIAQYLTTARDGRFMQSMKAFLPKASFTGTSVGGRMLCLEDLIAEYLDRLLRAGERSLGIAIEGPITFGRPARFSLDDEEEVLAEVRLRRAIEAVGIREFVLMREPIAAALAYESELVSDETVFVVDLGGGTSDFTLMKLGPSYRLRSDDSARVLATGGLPLAGDAIDGQIVEARLFEALGYGSRYRAFTSEARVPHWIFHKLKRWNHVSFLKERSYLEFLRNVQRTSDRPDAIRALLQIVEDDLGYVLFRAVERAKHRVAPGVSSTIEDEDLPVSNDLSNAAFLRAIRELIDRICATAREVLKAGEVAPDGVDAVFMTGGTSLVARVQAAFQDLFARDKIRVKDMFTSVVQGLAKSRL